MVCVSTAAAGGGGSSARGISEQSIDKNMTNKKIRNVLILHCAKGERCDHGSKRSWHLVVCPYLYYCNSIVNLTLSANHPVHPCAPAKGRAHAYTQKYARIHRESPEDAHACAQQRTHL